MALFLKGGTADSGPLLGGLTAGTDDMGIMRIEAQGGSTLFKGIYESHGLL